MSEGLSFGTLVVGADRDIEDGAPLAPDLVLASVYHLTGDPRPGVAGYGRMDNAGWTDLERLLGRLDGGEAVVFASGMAACVAALQPFLAPGDTLLLPSDGYYGVRRVAEDILQPWGVHVRLVPTPELADGDVAGVRLLWLETPSNPGLDCVDIAALAERAHAVGAKVVVDNTTPTALGQAPLALGADIVVAADTKALAGHSDALLGHVTCRSADDAAQVRQWRTLTGGIPGALTTYLVHRGLLTLDVRLERMCASAAAIARYLHGHPRVEGVRYPGLEEDPAHALAARQMRQYGFLVGMMFEEARAARAFLDRARLVKEATSFGGVHTTAEQRSRWGGDDVPPRFVRLSVGIEPVQDLLSDIERALR